MKDNSSGKAIKVIPEELIFDQVITHQAYTQQLVMKNNLSAPVELTLKSSNSERVEIEPKTKKLAPFESFTVDVTIKMIKQMAQKTQKQKETIFIKSDFFDQKVNVTIIPSFTNSTTPRETSLGSSIRITNHGRAGHASKRDSSRDDIGLNFMSKEYSPNKISTSLMGDIERELESKGSQIIDLQKLNRKQEYELEQLSDSLNQEVLKRKELEEQVQGVQSYSNGDYLEQVRVLLREREPNLEKLMDLTLKKERDGVEKKDAKILEILKIKDQHIEELQQKGVMKETEYGNLATAFQEFKRRARSMEEECTRYQDQIKQIQSLYDAVQQRLNQFESGYEYQRMREIDLQYNEAQQAIQSLQEQIEIQDSTIQEKEQSQGLLQEAIDRMREQIKQKDIKIPNLERELQEETQRRVSGEEHINSLMHQINQINQDNIKERTMTLQSLKSDKDQISKIDRLQNEKFELMNELDITRKEQLKDQERLRYILDRLTQVRGFGGTFGQQNNNASIHDSIERKVEDVARVLKEMEEDNIGINNKLKKQSDQLAARQNELQSILEENDQLASQVNIKKKSNGTQTKIDHSEMEQLHNNFEKVKSTCINLENRNEKVESDFITCKKQLMETQFELDRANQELSMLMKNQQNKKYSMSTQSEMNNNQFMNSPIENNDEIISRLNAKITSMKLNEDKLVDQINQMQQYLQDSSKTSQRFTPQHLQSSSQYEQSDQKKQIGVEERMGELELIIVEQRELLIKLEEANCELKQTINDLKLGKDRDNEMLSQKIKSLKEMNKRYEQIIATNKLNSKESNNFMVSSQMQSDAGITYSQSGKSTAPAETERMRQYTQQMELNNMGMKHQIEAISIERDSLKKECNQLKQELNQKEKEFIKLKQYAKTSSINLDFNHEDQSKLVARIQEQKQYIKDLEMQLSQQQSTSSMNQQQLNSVEDYTTGGPKNQYTGQRIEDLIKTNERLRKDHQQSLLVVMDLKEEYTSKLHYLSENYDRERQQLKNEVQAQQRKLESMASQIQYMEKKEMRLFGQLEESKIMQAQESEEKERRTRELEELLFKKEETLNDLEREIKQKERSLQERQEQLAVLIEALENEHSSDQQKQKILNLSAELCSLKAIEAQQEKKSNETTHQLKKVEMNNNKNIILLEQEKTKYKELVGNNQTLEKQIEDLQKNIQDIQIKYDDKQRECNDWKYKSEREEFQLQIKEESIAQMRDQIKRCEISFKEEIERIRKDQTQRAFNNKASSVNNKQAVPFKQALNSLHIVIADLLEKGQIEQSDQIIISELEKVITIASTTIESISQQLDKERTINCQIQNEYKALALNKILICRQETLTNQIQQFSKILNTREQERSNYIKSKDQTQYKLIREYEMKIQYQDKQLNEVQEELYEIKQKYTYTKERKEDLESEIVCYQQEFENQKQALEKKAELTVDERFKSKYEIIKTYFDSNITKILLNQGGVDKSLDLGREICSLKLLVSKLEAKVMSQQYDKDSLEVNLKYFKELVQTQEQKYHELSVKYHQQSQKLQHQDLQVKGELEKKKQENLQLEKDIMKMRDQLEERARDILRYEEQIAIKMDDNFSQKQNVSSEEKIMYEEQIQDANKQIQEFQDKFMDIRGQHIQELEELKIQYDLEVAEAKREIQKERDQLGKKYSPGNAPGDLVEQNDQLKNKIFEFKSLLENTRQENIILRKKIEQEKMLNENQKSNIQAHQQALSELETTLMEISSSQHHQISNQMSQLQQQTQLQNFQKNKPEEQKRKSSKGQKNQKTLHFNKEHQSEERDFQQSHSKIMHADSSLDVSAFTSMNIPIQRQSTSTMQGGYSQIGSSSRQFIINPPQIVKALVQSKVNEMLMRKKVEEQSQNEIQLRQQIQNILCDQQKNDSNKAFKENRGEQEFDYQNQEYKRRIIELEIENEDLKIQKTQVYVSHVQTLSQNNNFSATEQDNMKTDIPTQDYNSMVGAILSLSMQIATLESNLNHQENSKSMEQIEMAQRLVIKSLTNIININKGSIDLQYAPSQEYDRKIWYLELLESQVDSSENIIKNLQNFIKKLSIDISGNLQSAAQIKAASMDLAQNTKQTSEEIKVLRYVTGLIKHDLLSMRGGKDQQQVNSQAPLLAQQTLQKTLNPFADNINAQYGNNYDQQLMLNTESLQNQLTISDKVKGTLEKEIIALKISHAQELQKLQMQMKMANEQRDSLLETNEDLHTKVLNLETHMDNLKQELNGIGDERQYNMNAMLEKEREKDTLAKNKNTTTKQLQRLQGDFHDWRKQTDENMKLKEKQIAELTSSLATASGERDKFKAENQMLRRNEKDRVRNLNDDTNRLQEENQELQNKLNQQIDERRREIEFWVTERATMREMIDQLESEKVGQDIDRDSIPVNEEQIKTLKKKSYKKLKQKEVVIKNKDKEMQDLKDQLTKVKLSAMNLEQKIRESGTKLVEAEERSKYFQHKLKEIELEKDLVLAERNNAIESNDVGGQQIQMELDSLRECFAKLKVERDNLLYEIDSSRTKEKEWRQQMEQMNGEMQNMEKHLIGREKEQSSSIKVLDAKQNALVQDVKYLRQENERLKIRVKESEAALYEAERKQHDGELKIQEGSFQMEDLQRIMNDQKLQIKSKEDQIQQIQAQMLSQEAQRMKETDGLRAKIHDVKESNQLVVSLYENQIEFIKSKWAKEGKKNTERIEQVVSIAQREAVIKNLKKDNAIMKSKLVKAKEKSKELKLIVQNQENSSNIPVNKATIPNMKKGPSKLNLNQSKANHSVEYNNQMDKQTLKVAQALTQDDSFKQMLDQLQNYNVQVMKVVELEAEIGKVQQQNLQLNSQLIQQQEITNELHCELADAQKNQSKENKLQKQSISSLEISKQQKAELKALHLEIGQMKADWISGDEKRLLIDQIKECNQQIKSLKDEVQRKREVISSMKLQKEQIEGESKEIINDLEGLKDDNAKMQKLIKENSKNQSAMKDLKGTNEYLKMQEKKLKDEIISLNEKLKQMRLDLQRKEQISKDLKDKLDMIQDEVSQSREKQNEIERYKEIVKKQKLEVEIKESQVKSLKQRLDHQEEELENVKHTNQSSLLNSQQQTESQFKQSKKKLKKYELYLKKSLEALRKIGKQLTSQSDSKLSKSKQRKSSQHGNPMMVSELEKELMYKDSVNILGVSIDELEEFMNPSMHEGSHSANRSENNAFIAQLDKALSIPESLNQDLDQIGNYCVKLINDMNPDVNFL